MILALGEGVAASGTSLKERLSSFDEVLTALEDLRALCASGKLDDVSNVSLSGYFCLLCHE